MADDFTAGGAVPGRRSGHGRGARLVELKGVKRARPRSARGRAWPSRILDALSFERMLAAASAVAVAFILWHCTTMLFDFRTPEEMLRDAKNAEKAAEWEAEQASAR